MVATRRLTKAEAEKAVELGIKLPRYPRPSHPFSKGDLPDLYSELDLGKFSEADHYRLQWFFDRLCAIQIIIDNPVPYYFKEHGGKLRSLDAGCLGHLRHKSEILKFHESVGVISSVQVSQSVVAGKRPQLEKIISEMRVDP